MLNQAHSLSDLNEVAELLSSEELHNDCKTRLDNASLFGGRQSKLHCVCSLELGMHTFGFFSHDTNTWAMGIN